MPSTEEILSGVRQIANEWSTLAIFWHIYFGAVLLGLFAGLRPGKSLLAVILALPLLSVSLMAWTTGILFNAILFVAASAILLTTAAAFEDEPVSLGSTPSLFVGTSLAAYAWVYPHFLTPSSSTEYLYRSPLGLIPCPTLAMVVALTLLTGALGSRVWAGVVSALAVFYGSVGVFRLGVELDWALLIGGILLAGSLLRRPEPEPRLQLPSV